MKIQYCGMTFIKNKNGTYTTTSDYGKYKTVHKTFKSATWWIHEMADNNDIGYEFVRRICNKFECDVFGRPTKIRDWL